jgi:hypothetical protein
MNDRTKVIAGLVVFVALAAFPIWYTLAAAEETARPSLDLPENATQCVEAKTYMTGNHMNLLEDWRNRVVRDGEWTYAADSGEEYAMSLTGTCLSCHRRETFCQRCHDYANVSPTCWNCHVVPEGS